jgi:hypothetical protein
MVCAMTLKVAIMALLVSSMVSLTGSTRSYVPRRSYVPSSSLPQVPSVPSVLLAPLAVVQPTSAPKPTSKPVSNPVSAGPNTFRKVASDTAVAGVVGVGTGAGTTTGSAGVSYVFRSSPPPPAPSSCVEPHAVLQVMSIISLVLMIAMMT